MTTPQSVINRRYNRSAKGRAREKRYSLTAKGRARLRAYNISEKGKARKHRYHQTEGFKEHNRYRSRATHNALMIRKMRGEA